MINELITNLKSYKKILQCIDASHYAKPIADLSGGTIGQHLRHVLEFYDCLLKQKDSGEICYDLRVRSLKLEEQPDAALDKIQEIIAALKLVDQDARLKLTTSLKNDTGEFVVNTSFYRELAYNFDHSIHHQALIKIACKHLQCEESIGTNFGVAPSTIAYRKSCAQ